MRLQERRDIHDVMKLNHSRYDAPQSTTGMPSHTHALAPPAATQCTPDVCFITHLEKQTSVLP